MATYYWAALTGTWTSSNTTPWSDQYVSGGVGTRSLTVVTLSTGSTANMQIGQKVYYWSAATTSSAQGTVTGITAINKFTTSVSGTFTTGTWIVGNQNSGFFPTAGDDVVFGLLGNVSYQVTIPATTTVNCRNLTIDSSPWTSTNTTTLFGNSTTTSILNCYGDVYLNSTIWSISTFVLNLYGSNNTITKINTTGLSPPSLTFQAGCSYTLGSNCTALTSNFVHNGGTFSTADYSLSILRLTRTGTGDATFNCGNTVVSITSLTTTTSAIAMSNVTNYNFTTTGGYWYISGNTNRTVAQAVFGTTTAGQGPTTGNAPNLKLTSTSTNQFIQGYWGTLDLSATTSSYTTSSIVFVTTFIGNPSGGDIRNIVATFNRGGGYLQAGALDQYTPKTYIDHEAGFVGTTSLTTAFNVSGNTSGILAIKSGRFSVPANTNLYALNFDFSGTNSRGIDLGTNSVLYGSFLSSQFNAQDLTNFTATGDFSYYTQDGPTTANIATTGANSVTTYPNFYFRTTAVVGRSMTGTVNIFDVGPYSGSSYSRTVNCQTFIGSSTSSTYMSGCTLKFWGTGTYTVGLSGNPNAITFESDSTLNKTKGTTTLNSPLTVAGLAGVFYCKNQNINWNGQSFNATTSNSVGGSSWSNLGTFTASTFNAINGGTFTLNDGTLSASTIAVGTNGFGPTTFQYNGGTISPTAVQITASVFQSAVDLSLPSCDFTLQTSASDSGEPTLNLNGRTYTINNITLSSASAANSIRINGTGTLNVGGNFTGDVKATGNGTATISMTKSTAKSFAGGGGSYGTLNQGGAGALTITNSNSFANMTSTYRPSTITFEGSTTQTVQAFNVTGSSGNLVTINSQTAGTQFQLSKSSGTVSVTYLYIQDSYATGGATWNTTNSTNGGNNFGWNFPVSYTINGQFFQFFS